MTRNSVLTAAPINHDNNMSAVRYILSLAVLTYHFFELTGYDLSNAPNLTYISVSGFFALSGFLVFGSYCRLSEKNGGLKKYILSRIKRIMPPYISIVILSAILLCFLSTLSTLEYFSDISFWKYIGANLTFMNFLHPGLPGVFDGQAVNGSLWTMKVEWLLYLSVPFIFWLLNKFPKHIVSILLSITIFSVGYRLFFLYLYDKTGSGIYEQLARQLFGQFIFFYLGALIRLKYNLFVKHIKIITIIATIGTIVSFTHYFLTLTIMPYFLVALIIGASMYGKWGSFASKHDNISYQIYLFHFPIIQTLIHCGIAQYVDTFSLYLLSITITALISYLSNKYIDSQIMKIKTT